LHSPVDRSHSLRGRGAGGLGYTPRGYGSPRRRRGRCGPSALPDGVIERARGEGPAISAEGHDCELLRVPLERLPALPTADIPHPACRRGAQWDERLGAFSANVSQHQMQGEHLTWLSVEPETRVVPSGLMARAVTLPHDGPWITRVHVPLARSQNLAACIGSGEGPRRSGALVWLLSAEHLSGCSP
jgi:hypothetical protein